MAKLKTLDLFGMTGQFQGAKCGHTCIESHIYTSHNNITGEAYNLQP